MGLTKRMIENQEAQNGEAIAIAIAGGALRRCDYHSENRHRSVHRPNRRVQDRQR